MPISVDFETFYSKKLKYGLTGSIAEVYCADPLFDCYLISVCDGKNQWSGHPSRFNWSALDGQVLLSHNRYFDNTVYNELVKRKLAPVLNIPAWHCTANLTSYLCNRRALKDSVEYLFKRPVDKTYRDVADGKEWPHDYTEAEREHIIRAGKQDALACWQLWDKFSSRWPEVERRLSNITIDQGMRGVQIDVDLLNKYLLWTHDMKTEIEKLIPWMVDDPEEDWDDFSVKPTSLKCIAEQCRRTGIPCAPVKSHDEEAYEEWEEIYSPKHPWIAAVGAWRSVNKEYSTYAKIKRRLRSDGTLPFALKYFGAHTGRWSGDAGVNFQNQRAKPMLCNEAGLLELNDAKILAAMGEKDETGKYPSWVQHVIDFRALIIPRPGKKMIVSDLSQIEPRVLAWLGGNKSLLDMIRGGMSVYESFARASMGFKEPKLDKKSLYYKLLKIQVLGLGYGVGWEKFINLAARAGVDLTAEDPETITREDPFTHETKEVSGYGEKARALVKEFRDANPKITTLWSKMEAGFRSSIGEDFIVNLPSGRRIVYGEVRAQLKIEPNKDSGKPERKTVYSADVGGRRRPFYGGKLAENLTQAVARDVFAWQLVNMVDGRKWPSLFTVHDENVLEVDADVKAKDVEQEMSRCPEWIPGLPVNAEAHEVAHYQK